MDTKILKTEQDVKEFNLWVEGLESGKYKQTTGTLQDENGYCCLGLGCIIVIPKDKRLNQGALLHGAIPANQPKAPYWLTVVSIAVRQLTGTSLTTRNDNLKQSFTEIAKLLREKQAELTA